jgi:hypothetical protein
MLDLSRVKRRTFSIVTRSAAWSNVKPEISFTSCPILGSELVAGGGGGGEGEGDEVDGAAVARHRDGPDLTCLD